jgi:hypothetical protein
MLLVVAHLAHASSSIRDAAAAALVRHSSEGGRWVLTQSWGSEGVQSIHQRLNRELKCWTGTKINTYLIKASSQKTVS